MVSAVSDADGRAADGCGKADVCRPYFVVGMLAGLHRCVVAVQRGVLCVG